MRAHNILYEAVGENISGPSFHLNEYSSGTIQATGKPNDCRRIDSAVRNLLLKGLGQPFSEEDIIGIYRTPLLDQRGQVRCGLFQKEIEETRSRRGNANVRYAWLPCSRYTMEQMAMRGALEIAKPHKGSICGVGTCLAPANCTNSCARYSDFHEDGIIRMMLCRVIMGNVEVVLPGSKQFQPSNGSFDNGVDDLQNPQNYIVWDANVHKHIYAEYAVIVQAPLVTNECSGLKDSVPNISEIISSGSRDNLTKEDRFAPCGVEQEAPSRSGTSSTLSTSTPRRRSPRAAASPLPRPARTPPASRSLTAVRTSRSPTPSSWIRRTLGISSRWGGSGCSLRKMTAPPSILLLKRRSS
uniref:PARP catalytic domain-containing protein n=1 Tax=Zea mays TaxID=4577 RepID=C0P997_MAIZE|nr:unknown [Zea mays]